jgi:hypothetical protein
MRPFQYGIFTLGQIWTLTDGRGARLGFPSREIALAALQAVVAVHSAAGEPVEVTLQDEAGRLRTMLNPIGDLNLDSIANDAAWEPLLDVTTRRPNMGRMDVANSERQMDSDDG